MYKEIYFDHTFIEDLNHRFFKSLEKMGFSVDMRMVEHPGKAKCRFIKIGKTYLEFIHIGKGGEHYNKPGISFGATNLGGYYKKLVNSAIFKRAKFGAKLTHKNYDWKKNNTDYLPGWNFLVFNHMRVQTIYPWFTEYEVHSNTKKKRRKSPHHKNGVTKIKGAEIELNKRGEVLFQAILGEKLRPIMSLPCGFTFYFKFDAKTTRYCNVILESKNLKKTKSFMPKAKELDFYGDKALLVQRVLEAKRMWNILVVE